MTRYGLKLVTAPAAEPLMLKEVKDHLRLEASDASADAQLSEWITAARQKAEDFLWRALVTQTWEMYLDRLPRSSLEPIEIPMPPLQSIISVAYIDDQGATQTWAAAEYSVDIYREPGRVTLAWNKSWPTIREIPNAVTVRFKAGYGAAQQVPALIRQGMLQAIAHWHENREAVLIGETAMVLPMSVADSWADFRCAPQGGLNQWLLDDR